MSARGTSARAVIAAGTPMTAKAGARIARLGGNAVDIAVGAALTATVAEILMCSIAGSGFVMIYRRGKGAELIEGADAMPGIGAARSGEAPAWRKVHIPYGDGIEVMAGHGSVAVPGVLAALETAWKRHGSLPWAELIAPGLELSRTGWPMAPASLSWLEMNGEGVFSHQAESRAWFYPGGMLPCRVGDTFRIPGLDQTMAAIAENGADAFYRGDLAASFVAEMERGGGRVTRQDLAEYRAQIRAPLDLASRGFHLDLNPRPAVGGSTVGTLIGLTEPGFGPESTAAERALHTARVQAHVLGLRESKLTRPDFDDRASRAWLEAESLKTHWAALRAPHTTHMSIATAEGDAVAITMSMGYGAGISIPGTGIACNNSAGEPELNPLGFGAARPGDRFVSNMSPTIAWHSDGRCIALGSPGASRITTSIAQVWARYAFEGCAVEDAVEAPRLHVEEWHDGLRAQCEPGIDTSLLGDEFIVRPFEQKDMFFGGVQIAGRDRDGLLHAMADPRRGGGVELIE